MFSVLDDALPLEVLRKHDPALALADRFRIRPRGWKEADYSVEAGGDLDRIGHILATLLAEQKDLSFIKLDVVWTSAESTDRVTDFRKRTGLDAGAILRRCVIGDGADVEDWAALFGFALAFGWDAVAISRRRNTLVEFSHDEFLRATPPSVVRRL